MAEITLTNPKLLMLIYFLSEGQGCCNIGIYNFALNQPPVHKFIISQARIKKLVKVAKLIFNERLTYFHVPLGQWNILVRRLEVGVGENEALVQHHGSFDNGNNSAGVLQMTNVAFD